MAKKSRGGTNDRGKAADGESERRTWSSEEAQGGPKSHEDLKEPDG
jgi:hypothetical protein